MRQPDPFQYCILFHMATGRQMSATDLLHRLLPMKLDAQVSQAWRNEVELHCELLALRRLLLVDRRPSGNVYRAAADVRLMLPPTLPAMARAKVAAPLAAVMLTAGCAATPPAPKLRSYFDSPSIVNTAQVASSPPANAPSYFETVGPAPRARKGQASEVFRFCTDDCPKPTRTAPSLAQDAPVLPTAVVAQPGPPASSTKNDRPQSPMELQKEIQAELTSLQKQLAAPKKKGTTAPPAPEGKAEPAPDKPLDTAQAPHQPVVAPASGNIRMNPAVSETTASNQLTDLAETVRRWAADWQNRDLAATLDHYAADFVPSNGMSRADWIKYRAAKFAHHEITRVSVDVRATRINGNVATVLIWQRYQAGNFKSRVGKALQLVQAGGEWKIRREILRETGAGVPSLAAKASSTAKRRT